MHRSTHILLALACLAACGDTGKTSDAGTGEGSSSTQGASTGPASTSSASAASTDDSGSGGNTGGQTTSGSTTASTTGSSSTSSTGTTTDGTGGSSTTGPNTTGTTGPDTTGSTGNGTTGGEMCVGQGQSCAMGEACCQGLECCVGVPVPMGKEFCSNNCPISDRNAKADLRPIDVHDVLARVVALDITTWRYKKDTPDVRHLGPMAQDFKAAFGLGDTDKMIFPLDATGVSMAAIQALHRRLVAAEAENDDLRGRLDRLERRLAELEPR